jgi:hypothetical protein
MTLQHPIHYPYLAIWQDFPQMVIGAAIAKPHVQNVTGRVANPGCGPV